MDPGSYFSSDPGNPDTAAHFYADVELLASGTDQPDRTNFLSFWTTDQIVQKSNEWRGFNYGRYSNPEYDRLWQEFKAEPDQSRRKQLAIELNDLLASEVVDMPLMALQGISANPWDGDLWNIADWTRTGG